MSTADEPDLGSGQVDDGAGEPWERELRAEWRRFVRDHHPDRGGDPEVFAAGVRAYREGRRPHQPVAEQYLTTHRSPRGLGHLTRWARRRWDGWTRPPRVR